MRIDKFLSHTGFGSRKEVKKMLKNKQVAVDGEVVRDGKVIINENQSTVTVSGEVITYEKNIYYMLHKPQGVVSATEDRVHRTVLDLLSQEDYQTDIFPVGRLDKDTTGLLILTNDGKLSHDLLSPKKHVPKTYLALIRGLVTETDQKLFADGITISGNEKCRPAVLEILNLNETEGLSQISVTISEGKYHQVKRMFEAVGKQVLTLHRSSMGQVTLDEQLKPGDYRKLTTEELTYLNNKPQ